MFRFEKIEIWQEAINYSKEIYILCNKLPKSEDYGLISQLKRAAISISSNIAEGSGSSSQKDFAHYIDIAIKSTVETISQLIMCKELGYINQSDVKILYDKAEVLIRRMQSFKKSLIKK